LEKRSKEEGENLKRDVEGESKERGELNESLVTDG
jgi:hypothetical protein